MAYVTRKLLLPLAVLFLCLCVHESGHVLAAWASGGSVGEVVILALPPHVRIFGPAGHAQQAFRAIAGSGLSLLTCFAILLLVPARRIACQPLRDTVAAFGAVELLGWSLSAVGGNRGPAPDDAARFLNVSGASPYAVVAACAALALLGLLVFRSSGRLWPGRDIVTSPPEVAARAKSAAGGF